MVHMVKTAKPTTRTDGDTAEVARVVAQVIAEVRREGEKAVRRYLRSFDGWAPDSCRRRRWSAS